ncbi:ferrous iron transport protein B [Balneicella halophila]|uniref:Ferrous iron transport protein B n=1 Tax=Balneicella halophila TaxID=1537566 RepID=A0A7L4UQ03_BALHA|nr:ferrous iron transport protein B [Balneicella halophila]PVX51749.1 ferrous iron transport protein B [Balneicella halophila]
MVLSELKEGEKGVIVGVRGYGSFKRRLSEMGFIRGKEVLVIRYAPLRDPIEYRIMNYEVSLRASEASLIDVVPIDSYEKPQEDFKGTFSSESLNTVVKREEKTINVALVGNPNAGKTTFFNHASGSSERVGNYSGVTVSVKRATFKHKDYRIVIADLPGTYSLTAYSPEERYVRDYLIQEKPDIVINLVDASNLERNMFLTTQLIDMDMKVVMALNMFDVLKKLKAELDYDEMGRLLGMPIVPTISSKGKGISELMERVVKVYEDQESIVRHIHINYGTEVENAIVALQNIIKKDADLVSFASPRFLSLKLLEEDKSLQNVFEKSEYYEELKAKASKHKKIIEETYNDDVNTVLTDAHYGFISGALRECYKEKDVDRHVYTQKIDHILTNRVFGFPVFLIFMYFAFYCTFTLGAYPMEWIENGVAILAEWMQNKMTDGPLRDLLVDGIIGGVGGVLVFLPNIMILFFFISLMEDTGYMARTVFIMDKMMHKIGLHGRSFIPLVMGFGCNVPAIMATRTLNNRKDRMITMLINPFMSCSARLPVYLLLIGAFFPKRPAMMLFLIYTIGILLAIIMARVFRKTLFRSADVPFVMELPPYRMPTTRTLLKHMWNKGVQYLKKISGVILVASIIVWALGYFPRTTNYTMDYDGMRTEISELYEQTLTNAEEEEIEELTASYEQQIQSLNYAEQEEALENTYIARIGKIMEPAFQPLGFDWKMSVAILTGAAAKEVVVSTLGVLYQEGEEVGEDSVLLQSKLKASTYASGPKRGEKIYTPRVAFSLMLFILIYFPCIGVLAVTAKEASWKWALFLAVYTTALAYIISLGFYQISGLF